MENSILGSLFVGGVVVLCVAAFGFAVKWLLSLHEQQQKRRLDEARRCSCHGSDKA